MKNVDVIKKRVMSTGLAASLLLASLGSANCFAADEVASSTDASQGTNNRNVVQIAKVAGVSPKIRALDTILKIGKVALIATIAGTEMHVLNTSMDHVVKSARTVLPEVYPDGLYIANIDGTNICPVDNVVIESLGRVSSNNTQFGWDSSKSVYKFSLPELQLRDGNLFSWDAQTLNDQFALYDSDATDENVIDSADPESNNELNDEESQSNSYISSMNGQDICEADSNNETDELQSLSHDEVDEKTQESKVLIVAHPELDEAHSSYFKEMEQKVIDHMRSNGQYEIADTEDVNVVEQERSNASDEVRTDYISAVNGQGVCAADANYNAKQQTGNNEVDRIQALSNNVDYKIQWVKENNNELNGAPIAANNEIGETQIAVNSEIGETQAAVNSEIDETQAAVNSEIDGTQPVVNNEIGETQIAANNEIDGTQPVVNNELDETQILVKNARKTRQLAANNAIDEVQQKVNNETDKTQSESNNNEVNEKQAVSENNTDEVQLIKNVEAGGQESDNNNLTDVPKTADKSLVEICLLALTSFASLIGIFFAKTKRRMSRFSK